MIQGFYSGQMLPTENVQMSWKQKKKVSFYNTVTDNLSLCTSLFYYQ